MTDFEPFDDELASALQRRTAVIDPAGLATASAHDAVIARARGIRRRRAAIAGGATMLAVVLGGFLLLNNGGEDSLAPATQPSSSVDVTPSPSSTLVHSTAPVPTASSMPVTEPAPQIASSVPSSIAPTSTLTTETSIAPPPTNPLGGVSGQSQSASSSSSSTSSSSSSSSSSTSTTVASPSGPAPFTKTYNSTGGAITVRWDGSSLTLLSVDPATAYSSEIEDNAALRIRVRFRGATDSRVEVRIDNGQLSERID